MADRVTEARSSERRLNDQLPCSLPPSSSLPFPTTPPPPFYPETRRTRMLRRTPYLPWSFCHGVCELGREELAPFIFAAPFFVRESKGWMGEPG
ncbi:hypothetical protein Pcinc_001867 [Petrolisthes cinctipes]|uniref:Uncharacterized protein n=1 Tax=Petrolisthes cinctipes TaxID=88211 RepID=A0AAE1GM33_PETCI|nr:hypothetical protein Pcinc_001867 [Petrolisthes cinctipes]